MTYYYVEQLSRELKGIPESDPLRPECLELLSLLSVFEWKPKTTEELDWWQQTVRKLARDLAEFQGTDRGRINRNLVHDVIILCLNNL